MPTVIKKNILSNLADALKQATANTTLSTAAYAESVAKESMMGPKSGRIYKVSRTGKLHQASAPGEAPAIDTGNLVNSIKHERAGEEGARTYTHTEYAAHLEFGTAKMAPRPFMTPAMVKSISYMQKKAQLELDKVLMRFL